MIPQRIALSRSSRVALACAVAGLVFSASAMAMPTVYFGLDNSFKPATRTNADAARNDFFADLSGFSTATEGFESFAVAPVPSPTSSTLSNGVGVEFTHSATGFTRFLRISNGTGDLDTYSISGKFLEGLTESPTSYFSAAFDRPVHAIGFYATDASDWSGTTADDIKVLLTTVSMVVELDLTPGLDPVSLVSGNVMFFGVIDTAEPFLSIALRNESGVSGDSRDGIGIDDLTIGLAATAVPAPGTLPLLLGLLPLLGFLRRRAAAR